MTEQLAIEVPRPPRSSEWAVTCPTCAAPPGETCRTLTDGAATHTHRHRRRQAAYKPVEEVAHR